MKATRKLVAQHAKVSEATVSYVINNSKYVSPEVRNRVKKSMEELNYYPDFAARTMVKKNSAQVSVYLFDLANIYFGELISGIEKAATRFGYFVNVSSGNVDIKKYISNVIARHYDGVYISAQLSDEYSEQIRALINNGIKVVISNYYPFFQDEVSHIDIDTKTGVREQLSYLSECGHRQIAYLSAFPKYYSADGRVSGFLEGMSEFLPNEEPLIFYRNDVVTTVKSGYEMCKTLLASGKKFTAVMTTNDLMAFGVIQCLQENGKRVPEDVSVVGFDNNMFANTLFPKLTTSGYDNMEFGEKIFHLLYDSILHNTKKDIWLQPKLFKRDTVGIIR